MKTLNELLDIEETGWNRIKEELKNASNHYEILTKDSTRANNELLNSQITTHSRIGAIIYETGGILIDHGWLRILGSGNEKLNRGLIEWNQGKTILHLDEPPSYLLIADDVIGGFFAINNGGLGVNIGDIYYFSPDTLEWENLEVDYSQFLAWGFHGDINQFYDSLRWKTWVVDLQQLKGDQSFSFFPFLWTKEGKDIEYVDKKIITIDENYWVTNAFYKQLNQEL